MRKYSLFVLLPDLAQEQVENAGQVISEVIKKVGGQVEKVDQYGQRKLSYAVKKIRHGFYLNYILNLPVEKVEKLIQELKLKPEVLRFELALAKETRRQKHLSTKFIPSEVEGLEAGRNTLGPASAGSGQAKTLSVGKEVKDKRWGEQEWGNIKKDKKETKTRPMISLEELDRKLDNILETNI